MGNNNTNTMFLKTLIGFTLHALAQAAIAEEEKVLVLNDSNFDEAIKTHP